LPDGSCDTTGISRRQRAPGGPWFESTLAPRKSSVRHYRSSGLPGPRGDQQIGCLAPLQGAGHSFRPPVPEVSASLRLRLLSGFSPGCPCSPTLALRTGLTPPAPHLKLALSSTVAVASPWGQMDLHAGHADPTDHTDQREGRGSSLSLGERKLASAFRHRRSYPSAPDHAPPGGDLLREEGYGRRAPAVQPGRDARVTTGPRGIRPWRGRSAQPLTARPSRALPGGLGLLRAVSRIHQAVHVDAEWASVPAQFSPVPLQSWSRRFSQPGFQAGTVLITPPWDTPRPPPAKVLCCSGRIRGAQDGQSVGESGGGAGH
jgi:hypothetical protein